MNILFVCTGNTCRSCMAESIFNAVNNNESFRAFSAGVHVVAGSRASKNSSEVVAKYLNGDISDRLAVQLNRVHIEKADIILTMTSRIKELLKSVYPEAAKKIFVISEYVGVNGDVIDPYGGSLEVYEKTYFSLKNSIMLLLDKLGEDMGIN
jgi:protein-tyrosine phosphatase